MKYIHSTKCALLLAACLLNGCGAMPLSSMWEMRKFDLASLDTAQLRAALRLPEGFAPRPGLTYLQVTIQRVPAAGPKQSAEARVALEELTAATRGAAELKFAAAEQTRGARLYIYRIAPRDLPALADLKQTALAWKDAGPGRNSLSLSISPQFCRSGAAAEPRFSTYLKLGAAMDFVPLVRDAALADVLPGAQVQQVPRCSPEK